MIMPLLHLFSSALKSKKNYPARLFQELTCRHIRACLKNHSRNLHAPLCDIFCPNSVVVAHEILASKDYLKTEKIGIKNKYRAVAMTENKV
mgnify:CR=1 FL=1